MSLRTMKVLLWLLSGAAVAATAVMAFRAPKGNLSVEPPYRTPKPEEPAATKSSGKDLHPPDFYSSAWEKGKAPVSAPEPVKSAPDAGAAAGASFKVTSIFLVESNGKVRGFAAIESAGEESLYSEDAILPGGYRVTRITSDGVELEKDGKRFVLRRSGAVDSGPLPELTSAGTGTPGNEGAAAGAQAPGAQTAEPAASKPVTAADIAAIRPVEPERYEDPSGIPADRIRVPKGVVDYAFKNLHSLLKDFTVRTELSQIDNSLRGLRIDPNDNSLPYKYGFRQGDVIRAVNDHPLKNMGDMMKMYQEFQSTSPESVKITYERGGRLYMRSINIR